MVRFPIAAVVMQLTGSNKSEWKAGAWILSRFWPSPSLSPALAKAYASVRGVICLDHSFPKCVSQNTDV